MENMENKNVFASQIAEIDDVLAGKPPVDNKGIVPGIASIAAAIGKYSPGLHLVTGSQGTGKTMIMCTEAYLLVSRGYTVIYVTTEQTKSTIARIISTAAINSTVETCETCTIDTVKHVTYESREQAREAQEQMRILSELDLTIIDDIKSISDLIARITSDTDKEPDKITPDIIIIDSITNLSSSKMLTDETLDSRQKTLELLEIAHNYNVPIIGIAQASKVGITQILAKKNKLTGDDAVAIASSQGQAYNADTVCILRPTTRKTAMAGVINEVKRYAKRTGDGSIPYPRDEGTNGENEVWVELNWIKAREAGINYTDSRVTYAVRVDQTARVYAPDVYKCIQYAESQRRQAKYDKLVMEDDYFDKQRRDPDDMEDNDGYIEYIDLDSHINEREVAG